MLQRIRDGRVRNLREAREAGFTLIEMLIVIVVLGVLAGITVFGVARFKEDSEDAACNASVKTVSVAVDAFKAQHSWPAGVDTSAEKITHLLNQKYIKETPDADYAITIADGTDVVSSTVAGCTA